MKTIYSREEAERLAIEALSFIAQDCELLPRFLDLTGLTANDIRQAASTDGFMAGVLHFLLSHEPSLLQFVQATGHAPENVMTAYNALPGGGSIDFSW